MNLSVYTCNQCVSSDGGSDNFVAPFFKSLCPLVSDEKQGRSCCDEKNGSSPYQPILKYPGQTGVGVTCDYPETRSDASFYTFTSMCNGNTLHLH